MQQLVPTRRPDSEPRRRWRRPGVAVPGDKAYAMATTPSVTINRSRARKQAISRYDSAGAHRGTISVMSRAILSFSSLSFSILLFAGPLRAQTYDFVVAGGRVLDPATNLDAV